MQVRSGAGPCMTLSCAPRGAWFKCASWLRWQPSAPILIHDYGGSIPF